MVFYNERMRQRRHFPCRRGGDDRTCSANTHTCSPWSVTPNTRLPCGKAAIVRIYQFGDLGQFTSSSIDLIFFLFKMG